MSCQWSTLSAVPKAAPETSIFAPEVQAPSVVSHRDKAWATVRKSSQVLGGGWLADLKRSSFINIANPSYMRGIAT